MLALARHAAFCCAFAAIVCGCGGDGGGAGDPARGGSSGSAAAQAASAGAAGTKSGAGAGGSSGSDGGDTSGAGGSLAGAGTGGALTAGAGDGRTGGAGSGAGGGNAGGRGGRGGGAAGDAGRETGGAGSGRGGSAAGGASGAAGTSGTIEVPPGYTLVWHDEFAADGAPDPKNWKFEHGFVRNEEDQWYQDDNASVADGLLVIEGRKERVENPNYTGSGDWKTSRQYAEYTSSSLNTSGLQSFQYGRFEMRARIPTSAGMWPAWWTLGVSGEWPSNGEVDIMEYYSGKVLANVACGTSTRWEAKWDSQTKPLSSLGAGWSDEFHVWRMDWDDQTIDLYLDAQVMNTTALSSMLNSDGKSPFQQKAYLLVNLALGGNNGGSVGSTTFPVRYEVDYIRVFQKQ
jgi:beta-glucanase (GH16 family)